MKVGDLVKTNSIKTNCFRDEKGIITEDRGEFSYTKGNMLIKDHLYWVEFGKRGS